ncbi:MAG: cyclopropane-fatty-acyl-phospholipid synthase family protein [Actinomycetota bacterium]|nr:cyclopropane-fatty-acyl-phospholipid synthase family protein [Actinomycetota bacterium]
MNRRTKDPTRARAARAILRRLLEHVPGGTLDLVDASGTAHFGTGEPDWAESSLRARVDVHDARVYERVLRKGGIGLGESYADGWWDADDLAGFLRIALRGLGPLNARRDDFHRLATPIFDPIARLRRADPQRDARHVRAHYDLGNEFFARVLDETMAYSCAIFDADDMTLADASIAKFDRLARALDLSPGDRLLEIGTGWGGFALHAAQCYGCLVTTTTISPRQHNFALERVRAAGLDDRIVVLDTDYRDLRGTFDKAVAIEMIEAVDWREYDTFFERMRGLLTDDGALAMQAIVAPERSFDRLKRRTDFIKAQIFPGGCLPSVGALTAAAKRSGRLTLRNVDDIGPHYGETLRRWRVNLTRIAPDLPALGLDPSFARLWAFYFAYCEAGFEERYISATQLLYATPGFRPRPPVYTRNNLDASAA